MPTLSHCSCFPNSRLFVLALLTLAFALPTAPFIAQNAFAQNRPAAAKKKAGAPKKGTAKADSSLTTQLIPIKEGVTVYPMSATDTGYPPRVTLEFTLDDNGCPQNPIVVFSPSKSLDAPALRAIRGYRFEKPDPSKPDTLGNTYEKLSDARWQYEVNFRKPPDIPHGGVDYPANPSVDGRYSSYMPRATDTDREIAAVALAEARHPPHYGQNVRRPVLAPKNVKPVAPVYPYRLLKDNITGKATVRMPCSLDKKSDYPDIITASKKEFGLAFAAALYFYDITPADFMGQPTAAMFNATFDFNPANPELHLSDKTKQLLADEMKNPKAIISEDKLDKRLKIRQDAPATSDGFFINGALKGTTIIEFLVDETGHVHLPRIVKTDAPEAAYVRMQQISMRLYDPPLQNGKPVVARARETMSFDAKGNLVDNK